MLCLRAEYVLYLILVHTDYEEVTETPRLFEKRNVVLVEEIECAVDIDDLVSRLGASFARKFSDPSRSWQKVHESSTLPVCKLCA
jgi:hypothetical protein